MLCVTVGEKMSQLALLDEILRTRVVQTSDGREIPLTSEVDEQEGELLERIVSQPDVSNTIEIGCANGISSMYICGALRSKESPSHTIIDPFQSTDWHGVGVSNLERSGIDFFELIEEPSEFALPRLCQEGKKFDLALIDGNHTLDHTLVDFFFVNRLLNDGGYVLIDDLTFPGIKKVIRYVLNYPNYRIAGVANPSTNPGSLRRKVVDASMRSIGRVLPANYNREVFADSWLRSDLKLGIVCTMIALQKTGPDERPWDWYQPF